MYFWLKVIHIGAMAVWFTGLFFLPRLFVAHHRDEIDADRAYLNPAANLLFFRIATPAALVTTIAGMILMAWNPDGAWLVMKLAVAARAGVADPHRRKPLLDVDDRHDVVELEPGTRVHAAH